MAGVCLDALNPTGSPSNKKLANLGISSSRLEIRKGTQYTDYVNSLYSLNNYALIGPSTNSMQPELAALKYTPQVIIIGNEPDNDGPSSWTMSPQEYISLWNSLASVLKHNYPTTQLCTAGMLQPTTDYLQQCWSSLIPTPDLVNKHYPNNRDEIVNFQTTFNVPVIVGEWCWKTASQQEMQDWVDMLNNTCYEHFWFCWSDGMVPGMGLVTRTGRITNTYRRYKNAIHKP